MRVHVKALLTALALCLTGYATAADEFYYRHRIGSSMVVGPAPTANDVVVPGNGALRVLGPVSVRARPQVPFSLRFLAANAEGAVAWTSVGAPLPQGLSLSGDGLLSGLPQAVGSVPGIGVQGVDAARKTGVTQPFVIDVRPLPTVAVTGASLRTGQALALVPRAADLYGSQSWRLTAGSLPVGAFIDPDTGTIRGVAEQKGTFASIVLQVTDADGAVGRSPPFDIVASSNMSVAGLRGTYLARVGKPIAAIRPYVTGAEGSLSWTMAAGSSALPAGLALDGNGVLTGAPTTSGRTDGLSIKATDLSSGGSVASAPFSLRAAEAPTVSVAQPQDVRLGQPVALTPLATNILGTARWSLDGALPAGLTLDTATGVISGTPKGTGRAAWLVLKVVDLFDGARAQGTPFAIEIIPVLSVGVPGIPTARVGQPFAMAAPTVTGLQGTPVMSLAGALPDGLAFNPSDGTVTGTPRSAGARAGLSYAVTDTAGGATAVSTVFALTVLATDAPSPFAVAGVAAAYEIPLDRAFSLTPTISGNVGAVSWTLDGTLPAWLSLDPATGRLSGTPSYAVTTSNLRLVATDTPAATAKSQAFAVKVLPSGPLSVVLPPTLSARADEFYSGPAPSVSNGQGALAFERAAGTLPDGISVSPISGVASGTPRIAGDYPGIQVRVSDASGATATTVPLTLTVAAGEGGGFASIPTNLTGTVGAAFSGVPAASGLASPLSWTLAAGETPAWMRIDPATGALSGTPTETGSVSGLVLQAVGADGRGARTNAFTVSVVAQPVLSASMGNVSTVVGRAVSMFPSVTGAQGAQAWTLSSGALPPGFDFDPATGRVFGTPQVLSAVDALALTVTDAAGASATTPAFSVSSVPAPTLTAVMSTPLLAYAGVGFSAAPGFAGAQGTVTWDLTAGTLPPGLSLDRLTGRISGTVTSVGYYPGLVLTGTDAAGAAADTNPFAASVAIQSAGTNGGAGTGTSAAGTTGSGTGNTGSGTGGASTGTGTGGTGTAVSDTPPAAGTASTSAPVTVTQGSTLSISGVLSTYQAALARTFLTAPPGVSGARGPVSFGLVGSPPGWLSIEGATGSLVGTPPAAGNYGGFGILASDGYGYATAAPVTIAVSRATLMAAGPTGTLLARTGAGFASAAPRATGAIDTVTWSTPSALPPGLSLAPATGILSGTPSRAGTIAGIVLVARDGYDGAVAAAAPFSIAVTDALAASAADYRARQGYAFAAQPVVANAFGSVSWRLSAGTPPSWLSLDPATGRLSGTPGAIAAATGLRLAVTDASGATATTAPFSVTVTSGLVAATSSKEPRSVVGPESTFER